MRVMDDDSDNNAVLLKLVVSYVLGLQVTDATGSVVIPEQTLVFDESGGSSGRRHLLRKGGGGGGFSSGGRTSSFSSRFVSTSCHEPMSSPRQSFTATALLRMLPLLSLRMLCFPTLFRRRLKPTFLDVPNVLLLLLNDYAVALQQELHLFMVLINKLQQVHIVILFRQHWVGLHHQERKILHHIHLQLELQQRRKALHQLEGVSQIDIFTSGVWSSTAKGPARAGHPLKTRCPPHPAASAAADVPSSLLPPPAPAPAPLPHAHPPPRAAASAAAAESLESHLCGIDDSSGTQLQLQQTFRPNQSPVGPCWPLRAGVAQCTGGPPATPPRTMVRAIIRRDSRGKSAFVTIRD